MKFGTVADIVSECFIVDKRAKHLFKHAEMLARLPL